MPDRTSEDEAAIAEFITATKVAETESRQAAQAGRAALARLAVVALGHGSQAEVVRQWLASCYNSSEAPAVELDRIRRLDWSLQKDLVAVVLGCGKGEFKDEEIRTVLAAAGGPAAVDSLHWYTANGPARAALERLIAFIRGNQGASSAQALRDLLASVLGSGAKVDLSRLGFIDDEHTRDAVVVLDALYGRDQGKLHVEDIGDALRAAQLLP